MKETKLTVSPAPHWHIGADLSTDTAAFLLALIPATATGIFFFGIPALKVILWGIGTAVVAESLMRAAMGRPILKVDILSAVLLGLTFALLLPAGVPGWIVVLGVTVAAVPGRQLFGGVGGHPFHPVLVGYVILMLSYPEILRSYPAPRPLSGAEGGMDIFVLDAIRDMGFSDFLGYLEAYPRAPNMFLEGNAAGPIGLTGAGAILAGGVFLLLTRHIRWQIPVSLVVTVAVLGAVFHAADPGVHPAWYWHLAGGGALFAAFFLATDYTTSPNNPVPRILFGMGIGTMIILIRVYGSYSDGTPFAVLFLNLLMPLLDRIRRPSPGKVKADA